jgi:hypothetical protein
VRLVAFTVELRIDQDHFIADPRMNYADERPLDGTVIGQAAAGRLRQDGAMVDIDTNGPIQPVAPGNPDERSNPHHASGTE